MAGRLRHRSYETKDGENEKRTVYELEADKIDVLLRKATAKVTQASSGYGSQTGA